MAMILGPRVQRSQAVVMEILYSKVAHVVGIPSRGGGEPLELSSRVPVHNLEMWKIQLCRKMSTSIQCLKWSKKEAGSLPQDEVECALPRILFIFLI